MGGGAAFKALMAFVLAIGLMPFSQTIAYADQDYVAAINGVGYASLEQAINSAEDGDVITLLRDVPDAVGISVASGKNFVLDFNGKTYTLSGPGAGSTNTETNGFQLLQNSTIVFKNGTIRIAENANDIQRIIQNYANLTLENMQIFAENQVNGEAYALSFNNGDIVFKGNTSVHTSDDKTIAFDICKFASYPGVTVTFDKDYTGTVNGLIAYDSADAATHKLVINGKGSFGGFSITKSDPVNGANICITGGTFNEDVSSYVQPGMAQDEEGKIIINSETAVASVDGVGFVSLKEAIDSIQGEGEVTLLEDVVEDVEISGSKSVSIDLGGKKVTNKSGHTFIVRTGSSLEVKGEGTVDNVTHAKASIWNEGSVELNGGKYTRSRENGQSSTDAGGNSYYVIVNHDNMEISDGVTVEQDGHFSSMIENGYYSYNSENSDSGYVSGTNAVNPKLTIAGGVFDGGLNTVKNDDGGILEIKGGTFKNVSQAALLNWNETTISGGLFESESYCVLNGGGNETIDKGDLTITGGEFVAGNGESAISAMNDNSEFLKPENVQVSGGAFSSNVEDFLTQDVQYVVTSSQSDRYSYFTSLADAVEAAKPGDEIDPISAAVSQVTLTLKFNDGVTGDSIFTVASGASVKLPVPVRDGYDFLGWYDQAGNKAGESFVVSADSVLTAKWNSKSSGGGGGVVVESYDVTIGKFADGKVTSDVSEAAEGDTVTLTATPDAGFELAFIAVIGPDGQEVELKANADGTYSFEMPGFDVEVKASFACDGEELCPSHKFEDVDQDAWYHAAIDWAVSNKVLNGIGDTSLMMPNGDVTRAQMAAILWNVEGNPEVAYGGEFSDVADGDWFEGAVAWACSKGLFVGYEGSDCFGPNDVLTREQAAAVLMRWSGMRGEDTSARADLSAFSDASDVDAWAKECMSWAVAEGVINGVEKDDGSRELQPLGTATRAQAAALMMNLIEG